MHTGKLEGGFARTDERESEGEQVKNFIINFCCFNSLVKDKKIKKEEKMDSEKIKEYIQDCNVNFLIGSGASRPFLGTLGSIEKLLTELDEKNDIEDNKKKLLKYVIYNKYFNIAMKGNIDLLSYSDSATENEDLKATFENYNKFLMTLNQLILMRGSSILNKQINLFTTNIDIFLEYSLEFSGIEFNDGFYGRIKPKFNLNTYKNLRFKTSYFHDNIAETSVFNLFKLHGSLNWKKEGENIYYDTGLSLVKNLIIDSIIDSIEIDISDDIIDRLLPKIEGKALSEKEEKFLEEYDKLSIVNPTKQKFKDTVLNRIYYEMLRIYANELEKENTVLFVIGFSFADEHIRSVTVRALNTNPTLTLIVFAYSKEAKEQIGNELNKSTPINQNIIFISPNNDEEKYDIRTITEKYFNGGKNE